MLPSSFEYFKALQEGDYLLFLEWPAFIEHKYNHKSESLGADFLMDCMVFEWLAMGFTKEHIEKIAILYAVYDLEPSPLQAGKYAFPLMAIISAVCTCMVFFRHSLAERVFPQKKLSGIEVVAFIEEQSKKVDRAHYEESMGIARDQFMQQMTLVDKAVVRGVCEKIKPVIEPLSLLEKYILNLNLLKDQEKENSLFCVRLGIAQRFLAYMREQTEFNEDVSSQIALYVRSIRRQAPGAWEEVYLKRLAPPTLAEQSLGILASTGIGIFNLIVSGQLLENTLSKEEDKGRKTELAP